MTYDATNPRARVLLVAGDSALQGLLEAWLGELGYALAAEHTPDAQDGLAPVLIIVDLPYPRERGSELLAHIGATHPDIPVLVLTSSLLAGVRSTDAVARELHVSSVLPKPIERDALLAAVRNIAGIAA